MRFNGIILPRTIMFFSSFFIHYLERSATDAADSVDVVVVVAILILLNTCGERY